MTKQQKTESAIVHATDGMTDSVYRALIEQLFLMGGPTAVAEFLAARLRDPSPHRDVLDMVARSLDPQNDDYLKLLVVRQRRGKRWTKHVNDQAIAKTILRYRQELGRKRLSKVAVGDIADQFEISEAKVRKVISQIQK
jgi:hypothetical protein